METHFLSPEMYADDYSFLDQHPHQHSNLMTGFFDANFDDGVALGLLEDNFTNAAITSPADHSSSLDQRPAKQSKRSESSDQISFVVRNEISNNLEQLPPTEGGAPSPLVSSNDESTPTRGDGEKPRSKCTGRGQSHIIAERMRRERLTERFIALSALIPGLKKNDKGSILYEAIKYVKQLQHQVDLLEEENKKLISSGSYHAPPLSPIVFITNSNSDAPSSLDVEDVSNISSDSMARNGSNQESFPEVEARVLGKQVIIRIHCKNHKDVLMNILRQLEICQLLVVNTNVIPFGNSFVDITIVAQMEKEDHMAVSVVSKNIGIAISGSDRNYH